MRAILSALAAGAAVLLVSVPAQADGRHRGHDRSGVSFSVSIGDSPGRYGRYHGPRHDSWRQYPVYGYGYRPHPGYDYVRRNYYRGGHACYWDTDRRRLPGHRWAVVRELNCYDRYGRVYEVPRSRQVVEYLPPLRPHYYRRHHDRW